MSDRGRGVLVWDANPGYGWFGVDPSTGAGQISSVNGGPVSVSRFDGDVASRSAAGGSSSGAGSRSRTGLPGRANRATTAAILQFP